MYYVAYSDKGPSRPCGQTVSNTCHWNTLFVFRSKKELDEFMNEYISWHRICPKILGIWTDEFPESWQSGGVKVCG